MAEEELDEAQDIVDGQLVTLKDQDQQLAAKNEELDLLKVCVLPIYCLFSVQYAEWQLRCGPSSSGIVTVT